MRFAATSFKVQYADWHSPFEQTEKPQRRQQVKEQITWTLCVKVEACESKWRVFLCCYRLQTEHLVCVVNIYWLSTVASTVACFSCSINVSRVGSWGLVDIWTECYCTCSREIYACGLDCGPFWFQQGFLSLAGCTGVAIVDTVLSPASHQCFPSY